MKPVAFPSQLIKSTPGESVFFGSDEEFIAHLEGVPPAESE